MIDKERLVGKAHHLVLNAGAVAGAYALDGPAVKGRAVEVLLNDLVGLGVGPGDETVHLVLHAAAGRIPGVSPADIAVLSVAVAAAGAKAKREGESEG